jgi:hypothetical protein
MLSPITNNTKMNQAFVQNTITIIPNFLDGETKNEISRQIDDDEAARELFKCIKSLPSKERTWSERFKKGQEIRRFYVDIDLEKDSLQVSTEDFYRWLDTCIAHFCESFKVHFDIALNDEDLAVSASHDPYAKTPGFHKYSAHLVVPCYKMHYAQQKEFVITVLGAPLFDQNVYNADNSNFRLPYCFKPYKGVPDGIDPRANQMMPKFSMNESDHLVSILSGKEHLLTFDSGELCHQAFKRQKLGCNKNTVSPIHNPPSSTMSQKQQECVTFQEDELMVIKGKLNKLFKTNNIEFEFSSDQYTEYGMKGQAFTISNNSLQCPNGCGEHVSNRWLVGKGRQRYRIINLSERCKKWIDLPYELGDNPKDTPTQQIICWLQDQARERQLVKDHFGNVHQYILPHVPMPMLRNGLHVSIASWVGQMCGQSILDGRVWELIGGNSRMRNEVVKELENDTCTKFQTFQRSPGVYSFQNGILDLPQSVFYHFKEEGLQEEGGDESHHKLINDAPECMIPMVHLREHTFKYDPNLCAADYPTPLLQSTLEYQKFSQQAIDNIYAFMGLCMFPLNHHLAMPQWEIGFHSCGMKNTGKSLLLDTTKEFIAPELVGNVSSGSHSDGVGGGLQAIEGKSLILQSECTQNFAKKIEPATFCQLLSHEQVSITKKGKDPQTYLSNAPWWIASNEGCGHEKYSQCMRRLVTIPYDKYLDEASQDLTLKSEIKSKELPFLIIKSFLHFQALKNKVGLSSNVRNFLDPVFRKAGEDAQEEHNAMIAYLEHLQAQGCLAPPEYNNDRTQKNGGKDVKRCTAFYCDETMFKQRYKDFCIKRGYEEKEWAYSKSIFQAPFGKFKIEIKKRMREHWPPYENKDGVKVRGTEKRQTFLYGVWCYENCKPWDNSANFDSWDNSFKFGG